MTTYKITPISKHFNKTYYEVSINKSDENTTKMAEMTLTWDGQNNIENYYFASDETLPEFIKLMR